MNGRNAIFAAVVLLVAQVHAGVPVGAGDPVGEGDEVTLTGWITCEYCGKANANASGKACVLACANKGAKLLLFSGEQLYGLSEQGLARKHLGHEVVVTGTLEGERSLRVIRIEKKRSKDQPVASSGE